MQTENGLADPSEAVGHHVQLFNLNLHLNNKAVALTLTSSSSNSRGVRWIAHPAAGLRIRSCAGLRNVFQLSREDRRS